MKIQIVVGVIIGLIVMSTAALTVEIERHDPKMTLWTAKLARVVRSRSTILSIPDLTYNS